MQRSVDSPIWTKKYLQNRYCRTVIIGTHWVGFDMSFNICICLIQHYHPSSLFLLSTSMLNDLLQQFHRALLARIIRTHFTSKSTGENGFFIRLIWSRTASAASLDCCSFAKAFRKILTTSFCSFRFGTKKSNSRTRWQFSACGPDLEPFSRFLHNSSEANTKCSMAKHNYVQQR